MPQSTHDGRGAVFVLIFYFAGMAKPMLLKILVLSGPLRNATKAFAVSTSAAFLSIAAGYVIGLWLSFGASATTSTPFDVAASVL